MLVSGKKLDKNQTYCPDFLTRDVFSELESKIAAGVRIVEEKKVSCDQQVIFHTRQLNMCYTCRCSKKFQY